ncbi:MAG TPA: GAP family protein [Solirubrobacteraceae bacterium]|nr:GAP family protein [Solirubrobacteraceae bacterium]
MGRVFGFALTAALNPTLLTAVTVMLALLKPARLLLGYLLGAMLTGVVCGLVLVFALAGSGTAHTAKRSVSPGIDIGLGILILVIAALVGSGRDRRRRAWSERRRERARDRTPPRWKQVLSRGSARDTFVIGVLLSFPGASYIASMNALSKQSVGTVTTVIVVLAVNVIMLVLIEVPLLGYALRPDWTAALVESANDWLSRRGGRLALTLATVIGALLVLRGLLNL